ncbi:MAG: lysoplasmalogenase [Myxococcota bacterium]
MIVDTPLLRQLTKPFPVLAMIAAVLALRDGAYTRTIAVSLGFCVLGDIFLELPERFFIFGMIAFAIGHIGYIVAFVRRSAAPWPMAAIPFAVWIGWAGLFLYPHLGDLRVPVIFYTAIIFAMMWRATSMVLSEETPTVFDWLAMLGAMSFGFSDTLIALNKFHAPIEGVRVPIIVMYWLGQALIAASVLSPNIDNPDTEAAQA